ncbi:MAG: MASE3 domain-containing protein [Desulfobacterales bacterium]
MMQKLISGFSAAFLLIGLYVASLYNYLLFHSVAEVFSVVIAGGIFMVAWNTRNHVTHHYLLIIGIAYLFVGILDFVHTISYSGMNIFVGYDANTPTQLWIAARYMESLSLLAAAFMLQRRIRITPCFLAYGLITAVAILSIFYWKVFPDCFLADAGGLTPFKKISEYIICLILAASGVKVFQQRSHMDPVFLNLVLLSIAATMLSELAFTTYASVFGFSNLLGHYLKIVSVYLIYKAVIEIGLSKPYDLLFRDLHQQRAWLRVTLESIGDGVIATDTDGRISFMNEVAELLTGWRIYEAAGKPVQEVFRIVNEHTRKTVDDPVARVLQTGMVVGLANHTVLLRKDAGEIPIDDSGAPIRDAEGRILGAVLVFRDNTLRKQAEEELRQSRDTLQAVVEHLDVGVMIVDADGDFISMNPAALDLHGFSTPDEVIKARDSFASLFEFRSVDGRILNRDEWPDRSALKGNYFKELELRIRDLRTDGEWTGSWSVSPVLDGKGRLQLLVFTVRDITSRIRAQAAIERSNRELEQFAYAASHDLQEPLRSIVGFLQLFQNRYGSQVDEKGRQFIDRSVKAGYRMQSLVRDLLTLSRVNTKGETFTPTDLNHVLANVLETLQSVIKEKRAQIACGELPVVPIDASQIQSLFQNLILNGLKYNHSQKPIIEIGCEAHDGFHRFVVKDNGIGIPPKFQERIFLVFQRLHTEEEYPGTGLGLALCKKVVERHGGTLWVDSDPGRGSAFYFTLPRHRSA